MKKSKDLPVQISINPDQTPILYTDEIHMSTNDYGIVMDVVQKMGNPLEGRVVARIGMSRDHAVAFAQELGKLLMITDKKRGEKLN